MKARSLLVALLGISCLGASGPKKVAVEPFFPEEYERWQLEERNHRQRYHEGILVTGTVTYISRVRDALELIESADPRNWYFVRKHVRRITLTGHAGMDVGGGRFTSGEGEGETGAWLAGKIVHDAWHRELYFRGRPWEGRDAEIFCLGKQREFLERVDSGPLNVEEALESEYWKVDYWARDW